MTRKEAAARLKINKMLEESGWRLLDSEFGRANVDVETRLNPGAKLNLHESGDDFELTKGGFIDYLLLDDKVDVDVKHTYPCLDPESLLPRASDHHSSIALNKFEL